MTEAARCLNPYYTGIHLHLCVVAKLMLLMCLNPYYTGIHLHYGEKQEDYEVVVVLILIILEYIYIEDTDGYCIRRSLS